MHQHTFTSTPSPAHQAGTEEGGKPLAVLKGGSVAALAKLVTHQERMEEDTLLPRILSAAFILRTLQVRPRHSAVHGQEAQNITS